MATPWEFAASIERGSRPAKRAFTEAAETTLNAGGALAVLQEDVDLAKLPAFFQDFALIETEAISRYDFEPLLVPGLLQTEGMHGPSSLLTALRSTARSSSSTSKPDSADRSC